MTKDKMGSGRLGIKYRNTIKSPAIRQIILWKDIGKNGIMILLAQIRAGFTRMYCVARR